MKSYNLFGFCMMCLGVATAIVTGCIVAYRVAEWGVNGFPGWLR